MNALLLLSREGLDSGNDYPLHNLLPAAERARADALLLQAAETGEASADWQVIDAYGMPGWVRVWLRAWGDVNGMVVGLEGAVTEITALHDEVEQYRILLENVHDVMALSLPADREIALLDGDAVAPSERILYLSPSLARVLGYTLGEYCARPYADYLHPDDAPRVLALLHEYWSQPPAAAMYQARLLTKQHGYRWMETHITPVFDAQGQVAYRVHATRDIHDHKSAEEALGRAHAELARRAEAG